MTDRLEKANMIITYCDGEGCALSNEMALFLKETGFENVRLLANGYTLWQQADLSMQTGKTP
jgi:rhodanese-related sulfurtransferase